MKKFILIAIAVVLSGSAVIAQQYITLEDIWQKGTFTAKSVPGFNFMNDGKHYTRLEQGKIQQYDLTTGKLVQTIFDAAGTQGLAGFNGQLQGYNFSESEEKILVWSEVEPIYRHSTKAKFYVYDRQNKSITPVFDGGKHSFAAFSPQADKVAFVFENNLYIKDLASDKTIQVTTDGKINEIINGGMDWVYEEEFALKTGFQWASDGQQLAFYRFDERHVKEFTMTMYNGDLYPEYVTFKYPKVGEANAFVRIHNYDLRTGKTTVFDTGEEKDIYIPRIRWADNKLCIFRLNRHQSLLELLLANTQTGKTDLLYAESNKYYIEEATLDDITFLKNGKQFLMTSERDGWRHIYLHNMSDGKPIRQITKGDWEVSNLYGIDEARGLIFYQAAEKSALERQVYAVNLEGKNKKALADQAGWNNAQFSSTYDYFVLTHSTANTPPSYTVYDHTGNQVRMIEDNADLKKKQATYKVSQVEFFKFKTSEDVELNGWMIKPANFKENRKYPVLMFVYGGPGSQTVMNSWNTGNYWWFQMLAQEEYLIVSVDNRGTGGRGEAFKKMTYLQLGKYETIDQIEAAKYLGKQKYVDAQRIGIFGWSYGGYMSSLSLFKGGFTFRAAIAVAPVTNWKWYDSIYTERYMRTEKENPEGYRENSPVNFAEEVKGNYLIVHGMGDDNVHFQHTVEMTNALIKANKVFDTAIYPNRNHGIYGGNTRLQLYRTMTRFLEEKLKGPANKSRIATPKLDVSEDAPKQ